MLGATHRAYSSTFWLGMTGMTNALAYETGHGLPFNLAIVGAGIVLARPFSSGRNFSPDMDQRWAPGMPRQNYDWKFHRGITHRVWFAGVLTFLFCVLPILACLRAGIPSQFYVIFLAPVAGWWSHLSGDMIYGRIKILGSPVGLGWRTGGLSETGRGVEGRSMWLPTHPAERVFLGASYGFLALQIILTISAYSS